MPQWPLPHVLLSSICCVWEDTSSNSHDSYSLCINAFMVLRRRCCRSHCCHIFWRSTLYSLTYTIKIPPRRWLGPSRRKYKERYKENVVLVKNRLLMVTASLANYFNKLRNRWNPRTGKQLSWFYRSVNEKWKRKRRHNKLTVFSLITVSTQAPPCVRPKPKQLLIICSTVWTKTCPWLWFWIWSCVFTIRQLADAAVAAAAAAHSCQSFRFLHLQTCEG